MKRGFHSNNNPLAVHLESSTLFDLGILMKITIN